MRQHQLFSRVLSTLRPKTVEDDEPAGEGELERTYARRVIDLAMRIAETMLTVGESVNDATIAALQIVKAYGVDPVHVDITFTAVTMSYHRDIGEDPLTMTRVLRARTTDYTRLQRLSELTVQIEGGLPIDDARAQYSRITRAAHPYRRALVTLGNGLIGAGVAVVLNASWVIVLVATLTGALIDVVQHQLSRRQLPAFFIQSVGAFIATMVAMTVITAAREFDWLGNVRPSIIISAVIVILLAGMAVVGAAQDAIDGFYVTAGARLFEVLLLTLGIVIGIAAGLKTASVLGYGFLLPSSAPDLGSPVRQLLGAMLVAAAYALATYATPRAIMLGAGTALLSWTAFLLARWVGLNATVGSAIGALVASFLAVLVARRLHVPALALTAAGILPLVPGSVVFRGLHQLFEADGSTAVMMNGVATLMSAAGIGLAIAAGISLGAYFGRPTRDTITTAVRRLRGAA